MWAFYKKQLVKNQIVIVLVLAGLFALNRWHYGLPVQDIWPKLLLFLGVLELMLFPAAAWGARIQRQLRESDDRLPIDKR